MNNTILVSLSILLIAIGGYVYFRYFDHSEDNYVNT